MRVVNDYWRIDMLFWEVGNSPLQHELVSPRWKLNTRYGMDLQG